MPRQGGASCILDGRLGLDTRPPLTARPLRVQPGLAAPPAQQNRAAGPGCTPKRRAVGGGSVLNPGNLSRNQEGRLRDRDTPPTDTHKTSGAMDSSRKSGGARTTWNSPTGT